MCSDEKKMVETKVEPKIKEALDNLKREDESYDEIIRRMLKAYKEKEINRKIKK